MDLCWWCCFGFSTISKRVNMDGVSYSKWPLKYCYIVNMAPLALALIKKNGFIPLPKQKLLIKTLYAPLTNCHSILSFSVNFFPKNKIFLLKQYNFYVYVCVDFCKYVWVWICVSLWLENHEGQCFNSC